MTDQLKIASTLLLQSPPGEINDVLHDLRSLIADDTVLEAGILGALEEYNLTHASQLDLSAATSIVITKDGKEPSSGRFIDPRSRQSFVVDQMRMTISDVRPIAVDESTEQIRNDLDLALKKFVENHYHQGMSVVYSLPDERYPPPTPVGVELEKAAEEEKVEEIPEAVEGETVSEAVQGEEQPIEVENESQAVVEVETTEEAEAKGGEIESSEEKVEVPAEMEVEVAESVPEETVEIPVVVEDEFVPQPAIESRLFSLHFVGNKYNPSNYWSGRWRSKYVVDFIKETIEGEIKIDVHYYENGNVQLSTTFNTTAPLPSATTQSIIASIKSTESSTQLQSSSSFNALSEESFKSLRRALPLSRSKVAWDNLGAYKLRKGVGSA